MLPSPAAIGWRSRLKFWKPFLALRRFIYLSRFVSNEQLALALPAGSDYFAFALVGFAFFDYLTVSLSAFDSTITEAQQNGTLEAMLVTETPLTMILVASAAYPFVLLALRTVIYLAWGALALSFPHSRSQLAGRRNYSRHFDSGVCRPGNHLHQLPVAVQARESRPLADRGCVQPAGRHHVSSIGIARPTAMDRAAHSGDLLAWRECARHYWPAPVLRNCGRRCER